MLLEFLELEMMTGSDIANTILTFFRKKRTDIRKLRDQCYDRAPNMQPEKVGANSVILAKSPKVCVTHCRSHSLNSSITQCANIHVINNIVLFSNVSKKKRL